MAANIGIYPARIGAELFAILRCRRLQALFCGCPYPENSLLAIMLEGNVADNLGEFARGRPAHQVHLKKPVLGGDVSLSKKKIVQRGGFDRRNTMGITAYPDRSRYPGYWKRAIEVGKC